MSGLIDTNLLVYAVNQDSPHRPKVQAFLEEQLNQSEFIYVCWANLYEFLRVTTHPRVFTHPLSWSQAFGFLEAFVQSAQVEILREGDEHPQILKDILSHIRNPQGNLMHDCHVAALMKEHAVKTIYTHDTDFRLFEFLKVVDPI